MSKEIEFFVEDDVVGVLRVNRPAARNALNWTAQEAFAETVTAVANNPALRALIITGAGEQAFVAGGDLKELSQHPETSAGERLNRVMSGALTQLTQLPIPVIAAINGDSFGGGCEILTACDLRVASPRARFCFAQAKNGLTTGWGGAGRLVPLLGQSRALELLLTACVIDAHEAQLIGLVHRLVPPGTTTLQAALTWAKALLALPQGALAALKSLTYTAVSEPMAVVNAEEKRLFVSLWSHPDHLEALQAFSEKRRPVFNQ